MTADQLEALMQWVNARAMLAVEERETDEPCQGYVKNEETSRTAMFKAFGFAEHILGFPVDSDIIACMKFDDGIRHDPRCDGSCQERRAEGEK